MLKDLRIRAKLYHGFGIISLLPVAVGGTGAASTGSAYIVGMVGRIGEGILEIRVTPPGKLNNSPVDFLFMDRAKKALQMLP